jgi:hypothetical protein
VFRRREPTLPPAAAVHSHSAFPPTHPHYHCSKSLIRAPTDFQVPTRSAVSGSDSGLSMKAVASISCNLLISQTRDHLGHAESFFQYDYRQHLITPHDRIQFVMPTMPPLHTVLLFLLVTAASLLPVALCRIDAAAYSGVKKSVRPSLSSHPFPYAAVRGQPYKVDSDERAIRINGDRVLLQAGIIHYPRSTPDMWPRLMQLTRAANLNAVQTYGQRQTSRAPRCSACLS